MTDISQHIAQVPAPSPAFLAAADVASMNKAMKRIEWRQNQGISGVSLGGSKTPVAGGQGSIHNAHKRAAFEYPIC